MNERTREEFLRLLAQCDPKTRKTTMGGGGGRVSADRVSYIKEELSFIEQDGTTREVTFIESGVCDCGKLVTAKNPLKGTCQHPGCNNATCSECARTCRCGRNFCPHHATIYRDGSIYCDRCKPIKWLRLFFGIAEGGRKE